MAIRSLLTAVAMVFCVWHDISSKECYRILNQEHQPVSGAVVAVSDTTRNIVISAAMTDRDGRACLSGPKEAFHIITVSHPEYKSYTAMNPLSRKDIILSQVITDLNEVAVYANRDVLTQKGGTFIFTPGSLRTEVTNIYEMLKYTPLIDSGSGTFMVNGRPAPAKIKINGREPREWGAGMLQALQSLPATMVKRIEVSQNVGSGEDASFRGGVIDIVIAMPDEGCLNTLHTGMTYSRGFTGRLSYWTGWRNNRFKGTATASLSATDSNNESESEYNYLEIRKSVRQHTLTRTSHQTAGAGVNMSYDISRMGTLGLAFGINCAHEWHSDLTDAKTVMDGVSESTRFQAIRRLPWQSPRVGFGVWYTDHPNPTKNTVDIYAGLSYGVENSYNLYEDSCGEINQETRQNMYSRIISYMLKCSFLQILSQRHSISAGYKFSMLRMLQNQEYPGATPDRFRYRECGNAIFAEWNASWNQWLSTKIGLRGENLYLHPYQEGLDIGGGRNYLGLFPSGSVSVNIPRGRQSVSLSLNRRITPPWYLMLNPYVRWDTGNSYSVGNPDLKPSYGWIFSLTYGFLDNWIVGAEFIHEPKMSDNYTYFKDGYTVSSLANISKFDNTTIYIQFYKSFFQKLRVNLTARLFHDIREGEVEMHMLRAESTSFEGIANINYLISGRYQWRASLAGRYRSADKSLTNDGLAIYNLSAEISKDWKCGLSMRIGCGRIIYNRSALSFSSDVYSSTVRTLHLPVQLNLNLTYKLGNLRVTGAPDRSMEIK